MYVVETRRSAVVCIAIGEDGAAGVAEDVVVLPGILPDGLAVAADGSLFIGCYEPSQVLRVDHTGAIEVVFADPTAHLLCHPTNVAFRGDSLLVANLGRWHITELAVGICGLSLPPG
jgi:gluconolactonase